VPAPDQVPWRRSQLSTHCASSVWTILRRIPWGSVPLMIACAVRFRAYVHGETLNEDTPILVPETGAEPVALSE
jgi:hypothetical protein